MVVAKLGVGVDQKTYIRSRAHYMNAASRKVVTRLQNSCVQGIESERFVSDATRLRVEKAVETGLQD